MMINYAHRGASDYAPENTLASFYLGLIQGANGIETDVQKTKDGVLVLFHDDTLDRVTDTSGKLSDFTLAELENIKVFGNAPNGFYDRIVTLEEFFHKFSAYDISFAIELKGEGLEEDTLNLVEKYGLLGNTTFTSFQFDYIKRVKELNPKARVGWLVKSINSGVINAFKGIGGEEIAPKAEMLTPELVAMLRNQGLGIRAWGVKTYELMRKMYELNVDGMTVNFPDKLTELITGTYEQSL